MSISVGFMWMANFLVSQFFPMINENPYLLSHFHGAFPMWIFAICCIFSYFLSAVTCRKQKAFRWRKWRA